MSVMSSRMQDRPADEGSAYAMKDPTHNAKLTEVGRGTPMGELLRRYWHPVGLAGHATATPRPVRILGEDLILFRDGAGRPGLVHARCCHRGASLYYGRVDERGIRCCYHGWLFDVHGRCLEQPCEPEAGAKHRHSVRQPWYPLEERYGLVFAYLGPPQKKPVLPKFDALEELAGYGRVESIGWVVPIDDTHFRIYTAGRVTERGELGRGRSKMNGKSWSELTEEEHQRFPGDWEAQTGQGPVTSHSEEHLRTSDRGIVMLRRLLERQVDAVAKGGDPLGVHFGDESVTVRLEAGQRPLEGAA